MPITEFNEFFGMIMDHTEAIAVYQWHGYAAGLSISTYCVVTYCGTKNSCTSWYLLVIMKHCTYY